MYWVEHDHLLKYGNAVPVIILIFTTRVMMHVSVAYASSHICL